MMAFHIKVVPATIFRSFITTSTKRKCSCWKNNLAFHNPPIIQNSSLRKYQQHQQQQNGPSSSSSSSASTAQHLVATWTAITTSTFLLLAYNNNDDDWNAQHQSRGYRIRQGTVTLCNSISSNNDIKWYHPQHHPTIDNNNITILATSLDTSKVSVVPVQEQPPPPSLLLFPPQCLDYDHYKGVTIDLECIEEEIGKETFAERLSQQLQIWKTEGIIRGVWIHIPPQFASYVPTCIEHGFDFHMVSPSSTTTSETVTDAASQPNKNVLILSQWLPESTSRLPVGPTHQVGVGCLIWHPDDTSILGSQRRLLVVQEKSGPAATYRLWKLPTGLTDPNEDIHDAAIRELYEETGLIGHFDGLLLVRQAHPNTNTATTNSTKVVSTTSSSKNDDYQKKRKPKSTSVQRKISDLFFVCQMSLHDQYDPTKEQQQQDKDDSKKSSTTTPIWKACPQEIAAIQWMTVQDYCNQQRWQTSPLYMELNRVILNAASSSSSSSSTTTTAITAHDNEVHGEVKDSNQTTHKPLWNRTTLPVWVDTNVTNKGMVSSKYTNTFYSVK